MLVRKNYASLSLIFAACENFVFTQNVIGEVVYESEYLPNRLLPPILQFQENNIIIAVQ